jgi:hypothetical protein
MIHVFKRSRSGSRLPASKQEHRRDDSLKRHFADANLCSHTKEVEQTYSSVVG